MHNKILEDLAGSHTHTHTRLTAFSSAFDRSLCNTRTESNCICSQTIYTHLFTVTLHVMVEARFLLSLFQDTVDEILSRLRT